MNRRIALIAPLVLLAACQDEPAVEAGDDNAREAEGEVLGGTISDDMLPLDTLRSQSPPLDGDGEGENNGGGDGGSGTGGERPDAAASEGDEAGNPAEQNPAQQDPVTTPEP